MRAALAVILVTASVTAAVFALGAGDGDEPMRYRVQLDSGFGLVEDGDVKIAGVRAGHIADISLDRRTLHALVEIEVTDPGFGELRADARCGVRPQSLLGEYFLNCDPGTSPTKLDRGAVIPVERTTATIPADLVANILRRPFAERLRIVVNELGAGVAGNGERLNAAVRRAVPAIDETRAVLRSLRRQEDALDSVVRDADMVLGELARGRRDVGRFVVHAAGAAGATATRDTELATALGRLPAFLAELTPTMRELRAVADRGVPALRETRRAAPALDAALRAVQPFAAAASPALQTLSAAADRGRPALTVLEPMLRQLDSATEGGPELLRNTAALAEHLDDRDNAIETHVESPGGRGFTGLEGILRYVRLQTLNINVFDHNSHLLKQALLEDPDCIGYVDLEHAKTAPKKCFSVLGPRQVGINSPDPTLAQGEPPARRAANRRSEQILDYLLRP